MKKHLLLASVALIGIVATARAEQPEITSYPAGHSVYVTSYYGGQVTINYGMAIVSDATVTATVEAAGQIINVEATPFVGSYTLGFPVIEALETAGITSGVFTIDVPSVQIGTIETTWDESWNPIVTITSEEPSAAFTADYLLRDSFPSWTANGSAGLNLPQTAEVINHTIYTIDGRVISVKANQDVLSSLPNGLYIIDDKKIAIYK